MGTDAGQILLDTDLAVVKAGSSSKPAGRMVQTVTQTGLANNTIVAMSFTTEELDTDNYHNNVTNNTRVTPSKAGWYRVHGSVAFSGQTDYTAVEAFIRFNGASGLPPAFRITPGVTSTTVVGGCTALVLCNGTTDYFELCYRATRSGAGTSGTTISVQFATVLEWQFERDA
jgi:hypothetical protein